MSDENAPCTCPAWNAEYNDHTEAEHTDCGKTSLGPAGACGGCDECVSAQIFYWRHRRNENGVD